MVTALARGFEWWHFEVATATAIITSDSFWLSVGSGSLTRGGVVGGMHDAGVIPSGVIKGLPCMAGLSYGPPSHDNPTKAAQVDPVL